MTEEIRFECQGSGKCCVSRGDVGFVYLTGVDLLRLSGFLKKKIYEFANYSQFDYTRFKKSKSFQWYLKSKDEACLFLKNGKCSVYAARPQQCRTWPFYPEHMNAKAWSETAKFCPGIGKGPVRSKDEIEKIVNAQQIADSILAMNL